MIKRFFAVAFAALMIFSLTACTAQYEKADKYANNFISALCLGDEAKMKEYTHPDYTEQAIPDEAFYETLATQFFTVGNEMTALNGVGKAEFENADAFDGETMKCTYVARVNELFYTVELITLENDNGYGIVSVAMVLNTDLDYYFQGE
ncbi:MAG: hypothetical protein IKU30_03210 [Clostridia bacterium]|nr:hypothetical protein [Clostridia bacterium]